jgi:hypothetical protein
MKKFLSIVVLALAAICINSLPAQAASGGNVQGLKFDAATRKLFGNNQHFTADIEVVSADANGNMSILSRMSASESSSRFEFSVADIKGAQMPANAVEQMKAMGMDRTIVISRDSGRTVIMIYPGLSSYVEMPITQAAGVDDKAGTVDDFKVNITEIGAETVDGHKCVKNKVVVIDKEGAKHESTVWNAKDMKSFPIMIKTVEGGLAVTMHFKNVSFATPSASLFVPPAGYSKYASMQAMMQQEMMKRLSQVGAGKGNEAE